MLSLAWGECLRGRSFIISIIHGTSCNAKWYTSSGKMENSSLFDHKLQKPPETNEYNIASCYRLGPMTNRKSTARCRWEIIHLSSDYLWSDITIKYLQRVSSVRVRARAHAYTDILALVPVSLIYNPHENREDILLPLGMLSLLLCSVQVHCL